MVSGNLLQHEKCLSIIYNHWSSTVYSTVELHYFYYCMKNKLDLAEEIATKCLNHAVLLASNIPPEQALKIAFGDEFANKAIKEVEIIEKELKLKL